MIVKRSRLLLPPSVALHIEQSTCRGVTMITIVLMMVSDDADDYGGVVGEDNADALCC